MRSWSGDLPELPSERRESTAERRARVGPPGRLPFTHRATVPASPDRTRAALLDKLAPPLNRNGYELVSQAPNGLVFKRSTRPGWAVAVAIFAFPIGLLALGVRTTDNIVISLERSGPKRTDLTVHGTAPRGIRKAFAALTFR